MRERGIHRRRSGNSDGFSLLKLAVLLAVLIALAAGIWVITPRFGNEDPRGRTVEVQQDIDNIKTALDQYKESAGRYPTTAEGIQSLVHAGSTVGMPYGLEKLPIDPWGHEYVYRSPGRNGNDFDLYSTGPSGVDGNADNIH